MNNRYYDVLSRVEDVAKQRLNNPHTQGVALLMLYCIHSQRKRQTCK